MAKANPLVGSWKRAGQDFIARTFSQEKELSPDAFLLAALKVLAVEARRRKTERDRANAWYTELRKMIVATMLSLGLAEAFANTRTFFKLSPDLVMGKDKKGKEARKRLATKYGEGFARRHVFIEEKVIPARTERVYTFIPPEDATTTEKIEWTSVMGNTPEFKVGDPSIRAKEGKERRKRPRKKRPQAPA